MKQFGDYLIRRFPAWFWPTVGIAMTIALCVLDARAETNQPCPILDTTCGTTSGGQKAK